MEHELFQKLPSGGGWWNVQHPYASNWLQRSYDKAAKGEVVEHQTVEPKKFVTFEQVLKVPPPPGRQNGKTAFKMILDTLDPCSSLYTKEQEQDAIDTVRDRMLSFVTGLAQTYFGPKKSRVLSLWLSNNRIQHENAPIIDEFLRFLFEEKANEWFVTPGPRGEWYIKN